MSTLHLPHVVGRLEVTIKFSELPQGIETRDGVRVSLDCGEGLHVSTVLRPKTWKKLQASAASFPLWVAAMTGKMGPRNASGFVLLEPAVQVFEKKPKAQPAEPAAEVAP